MTAGSGDVFRDLGVALDKEERLKFDIAIEISAIIERAGMTQAEVGKIIGADQAKVSSLTRGRLKGFSLDRLIQYLLRLGYDIDVRISQRQPGRRHGEARVHTAPA